MYCSLKIQCDKNVTLWRFHFEIVFKPCHVTNFRWNYPIFMIPYLSLPLAILLSFSYPELWIL